MKQLFKRRIRAALAAWLLVIATVGLGFSTPVAVAATRKAGDLMVVGWNAYTNVVHLVALADIPRGTDLRITDRGWSINSAFTTNTSLDGLLYWRVETPIAKGAFFELTLAGRGEMTTLINMTTQYDLTSEIIRSGYSGDDPLTENPFSDGLFIYQDEDHNPFFIFGFNNDFSNEKINGWTNPKYAAANSPYFSTLPSGVGSQNALTNGVNAIGMTGDRIRHNVKYAGPATPADVATWQARFTDVNNWAGDDNGFPGTTTSTLDLAFGKQLPIVANTAPSLSLDAGTQGFVEKGAGVPVAPSAAVADAEGNWLTGSLAVRISDNADAADTLAIANSTGLTVAGSDLLDGGTVFGTLSAAGGSVSGGAVLTITFNGNATTARVQQLVRAISFANASNAPATATRTISFTLLDGAGGNAAATRQVTVAAVNDPPAVAAPGSIAVTEDVAAALTGISITDPDAGDAGVTASFAVSGGSLSATPGGGVAVAGSGSGLLTLSGGVASLNVFIAAGKLSYLPAPNANGNVTLSITVDDGGNTGSGGPRTAGATVTLAIQGTNDPPVVTAPAAQTIPENTATALAGISFADPDAGPAPVRVTFSAASGTLTAGSGGGVTASGSGSGTLILEGAIANLDAFLAAGSVRYVPVTDARGNVSLVIGIDDLGNSGTGGTQTAAATMTLSVVGPNRAPTISAPGTIVLVEDTASPLTGISFADADAGAGSLTATLAVAQGRFTAASGGGVTVAGSGGASLTLTGSLASLNAFLAAGQVLFQPVADFAGNLPLSVGINDNGNSGTGGAQSASATVNLSVTPVNDPPVQTLPAAISVVQTTPSALTGLSIADIDNPDGPILLLLRAPAGTFSAVTGGAVSVSGSGTGTLSLQGSPGALNGFIAGGNVKFTTAPDATGSVTLTVSSDDGRDSVTGTVTLNIRPLNKAPVLTVPAAITVVEDVASPLAGLSVVDPDAGSGLLTLRLSVDSGTLTATAGGGVTVSGSGTASLTLAGTLANLNAFLGNVRFLTAANQTASATLTVVADDNGNTGEGGAGSDSKTAMLNVTPVNDLPGFTASNPLPVAANAGPQRIANWAKLQPGGGADESGQAALAYAVTAVGTPGLFAVPPTVAPNGTLSFTPSGTLGSSTFTVQVRDDGGTANGGVDTSAPQTFTITVIQTTATLALHKTPSGSSALGQTVSFAATVSGLAPTGTVAFTANGNPIAGCAAVTLSGGDSRQASCSTSALPLGTHTIAARYGGDAGNTPASANVTHTVSQTPTTVEIITVPAAPKYGEAVTATANVLGGIADGTVSFWLDGQPVASCQARSDATCRLPALTVGSHVLRAIYSGAGATGASEASKTLPVELGRPPLNLTAGIQDDAGQLIEVAMAAGTGYQPPTGQVVLQAAGAQCTAPLSGGTGRCRLPVKTGSTRITASYAGDANYAENAAETRLEQLKGWPHTGWWWAATAPGRGYFFDVQNGQLLVAVLAFDLDGASRWYLAQGALQPAGPERWTYSAPLWRSAGGQELGGEWRQARFDQVVGTLSLWFDGPTRAMQQGSAQPLTLSRFPFSGNVPGTAGTGQPETGFWWNPAEPGRGFLLEVQSGSLMVAATAYEPPAVGGAPAWYLGGANIGGTPVIGGSWSRLGFGPTWSQPGTSPSVIGSAGSWRLQFGGERSGTLTQSDGRQVPVERFLFQ